jgi:hypothetical protein
MGFAHAIITYFTEGDIDGLRLYTFIYDAVDLIAITVTVSFGCFRFNT